MKWTLILFFLGCRFDVCPTAVIDSYVSEDACHAAGKRALQASRYDSSDKAVGRVAATYACIQSH